MSSGGGKDASPPFPGCGPLRWQGSCRNHALDLYRGALEKHLASLLSSKLILCDRSYSPWLQHRGTTIGTMSTKVHGGWEFYRLKTSTSGKTQLGEGCQNSLN